MNASSQVGRGCSMTNGVKMVRTHGVLCRLEYSRQKSFQDENYYRFSFFFFQEILRVFSLSIISKTFRSSREKNTVVISSIVVSRFSAVFKPEYQIPHRWNDYNEISYELSTTQRNLQESPLAEGENGKNKNS